MLKPFLNAFKITDLRNKILYTAGLLAVCRVGAYIPTPGVDTKALFEVVERFSHTAGGGVFGLMDMFSGGAMANCSIFALGIMPYISMSIIMQLLCAVIPSLEKLQKEGDAGRRKINQYTRYGTVALCAFQALMIAVMLLHPQRIHETLFAGVTLVPQPGFRFMFTTMVTMTAATIFVMWVGEQITEKGIGNGISLIITANIVSRVPTAIEQFAVLIFDPATGMRWPKVVLMAAMMVAVVLGIIAITQGERKIPVQYARRIVGRKVYTGQNTYIPLKVNLAGVIPIIFAQSVLMLPGMVAPAMPQGFFLRTVLESLVGNEICYIIFYSSLIIVFTYFWTAVVFNPQDVADNMKKFGGFVPGVRPGKQTADTFYFIMNRITLAGAIALAVIAVLPSLITRSMDVPYLISQFFGGTGLLIIVGVMLDTVKQVESHLLMRHYEGFMKKGRIRGRR